ncbi:MAG: dihydroorotase [Rikenellaceae bacterium]|nr:dihydroorotase [Rikenellaceae bacterium]
MARTLINNGTILAAEGCYAGYVIFEGDTICEVGQGAYTERFDGTVINAAGKYVMPGVIDAHVHFREPGLTHKADWASESAAAAAGGVTSVFDMPNTNPVTVSLGEVERKAEIASQKSVVNYSVWLGATNSNLREITRLNPREVCGVKLFMGSSTGGMLVDDNYTLSGVFAESPIIISAHCESEARIAANSATLKERFPEATATIHPEVRDAEACYASSALAVELADKYGSRLNVAHITTARELALFDEKPLSQKKITAEVTASHLWFCDEDYPSLGNFIKCNPSIKSRADREALRLTLGRRIDTIATDHAPHALAEKQNPYWNAPSGMPMIGHSLVVALELARMGVMSREMVVRLMCNAPADLYNISDRGYLRAGCKADIVIVDPMAEWTVSRENIISKCGWSPLVGTKLSHRVVRTYINGREVWNGSEICTDRTGERIVFAR